MKNQTKTERVSKLFFQFQIGIDEKPMQAFLKRINGEYYPCILLSAKTRKNLVLASASVPVSFLSNVGYKNPTEATDILLKRVNSVLSNELPTQIIRYN